MSDTKATAAFTTRKKRWQYLQVLVIDFKHVGDVERSVLGAARLFHELRVDVASRGHDHNYVLPLLVEKESDVPDFGTWQKEIESWAQGIYREIVDLWEASRKLLTTAMEISANGQELRQRIRCYTSYFFSLRFFGFAVSYGKSTKTPQISN